MPKATASGASNAWEQPPQAAAADEPVTPEPAPEPAPEPNAPEPLSAADVAAGYTDLSYAELRAEAKARGLPAGGSAVELAARLAQHDETNAAPAATEEGS